MFCRVQYNLCYAMSLANLKKVFEDGDVVGLFGLHCFNESGGFEAQELAQGFGSVSVRLWPAAKCADFTKHVT